jgi:D-serine deaminase-like pyridoxal phosphate-dependent protein
MSTHDYHALVEALKGQPLPAAILDLDRLDANAKVLVERARGKPIRLGTKSIRCTEVLRRLLVPGSGFEGLLCYSAREAAWLAAQGFDDLLVAYPTTEPADLAAVALQAALGKRIALMVDDPEQLKRIAAQPRPAGLRWRLAIDLDMSSRFPGLYFGVQRSPLRSAADIVALAKAIAAEPEIFEFAGLMGYEAQIAGLQDAVPGAGLKNPLVRWLKRRSLKEILRRRQDAVAALKEAGLAPGLVNGGGTGSVAETAGDASVTEIAAGSGLYCPGLFDHFRAFKLAPALFFALPVVRRPGPGLVTCAGGGYIASGPTGPNRAPLPYLPEGLKLLPLEGAGEVQTPLALPEGTDLPIGAPVFFRHAKAGELAERFERFLIMTDGRIVGAAKTYRGEGQCFF